jgi:chemotaxis protein MotB
VAQTPEIIFIKKKNRHGARHGGAWKVAYADFVTGMMALFIVLWLMNSSQSVQLAVSGYFKDPMGSAKTPGTSKNGSGEKPPLKKEDMGKLKQEILKSIHRLDPLDKLKHQIEITITNEGLRIELMESAKGTFFELGSALPTPALKELLNVLSPELGKLPNKMSIEGHTDSTPYAGSKTYDNWDLSTDRANEARRIMQQEGVREDQVSQVRGFADQHLRLPLKPRDPSNRRISLIVLYQIQDNSELPVSSTITQSKVVQPTPQDGPRSGN